MNTPDLKQIRTLSNLASRASAALLPLASDGVGADSHGGAIKNPQEALDSAMDAMIEGGALAAQLRREAAEMLRP